MAHDPKKLDYLESLPRTLWNGIVFRYTAGGRPPERENTLGARWNRKDDPAIYTALDRDTAIAELRHALDVNKPRPTRGSFTLYRIRVEVGPVVDLRLPATITGVGLTPDLIESDDHSQCQAVGAAARFLNIGGILVPSARRDGGANLVIFPDLHGDAFVFEVQNEEVLAVGVGPLA